jgi:hypothetical protein
LLFFTGFAEAAFFFGAGFLAIFIYGN